jgi:hypothetical protein
MFARDYISAAQFLGTIPPEVFEQSNGDPFGEITAHGKLFYEALMAVAINSTEKQKPLERAETAFRSALQSGRCADRAFASADLAIIQALAGRKQDAILTAQSAVEDVRWASIAEINDVSSALALVYAQTDESDKAIDLIEHLLTAPCQVQRGAIYNMTLTDLKWRWIWDPLRNDPRFQKLLAGPEPKTIY